MLCRAVISALLSGIASSYRMNACSSQGLDQSVCAAASCEYDWQKLPAGLALREDACMQWALAGLLAT